MKYIDCTKEKAPGWISRKIIREYPYIILTNIYDPLARIVAKNKIHPKPQWLMENLSSKSGFYEIRQYEYIIQGTQKNKNKVGVAFKDEAHAMAFKLMFP